MSVADIFADAQKSSINHKTLTKRLRKLEAKHESQRTRFEEQVKQCVVRSLEVTKSEKAGANIVKFLCAYCAATQGEEQESEDEESNNITNVLLLMLLPYMSAKDKVVRYRATQIISQLMGIVQEIEDDLYQAIRHELIKRIRDRVPAIRLEAVCALGRLLENEMDEEAQEKGNDSDDDTIMSDEAESTGLLAKLLDVLQNDTNADVRKALLLNLPIEPKTLPYLLERARDKDAPTRRALYAKLMPNLGDFRHLSLSMREKLLRWGLRDRDERVRKAAVKMFSSLWIEQIAKTLQQTDPDEQEEKPTKKNIGFYESSIPALLELLERIDILNSGQDDGIGLEAMREFWTLRPDYFNAMEFRDEFWGDLSVESAFMARSFYDYCAQDPDALAEAEDKMPEVTRFGFHLQRYLNQVLETRQAFESGAEIEEETIAEQEFIAEQLLHIAHTLDYTDEIGRRKMFSLLRNMLSIAEFPEEMTRLTVEALRLTCASNAAGEKEFIAVVTEAITEVHDTLNDEDADQNNRAHSPDDNESFVSAHSELSSASDHTATAHNSRSKSSKHKPHLTPEEQERRALRELLTNLKCLSIAHTLLQNITTDTSKSMALETLLNDLIIPSIRSEDTPLRERAIECLGLACLLSPKLAEANRELFTYCMKKGHDELRTLCLKVLCDMAVTWEQPGGDSNHQDRWEEETTIDLEPFMLAFGYSPEMQQVATTCIAKLMMCGFYKGKDGSNVAAFDQAIEEAEQSGAKGWELLAKVKAAIVADTGAGGQKEGGDEERTRQS
ncbi:chromosome condensation complex Condensin, subunit G [Neophaeococcomyces mojaviensis]|uniref:Chromosome condensation complex Condensin, subunit G n=1 Tax=Neophaeococcomyces mojaviensis TaxID=3383035 RepID=A0ACC3AFB6_9EURO|nr:chromosome condensation complex Condensin, subunit G [Knufia sp. JES_112]